MIGALSVVALLVLAGALALSQSRADRLSREAVVLKNKINILSDDNVHLTERVDRLQAALNTETREITAERNAALEKVRFLSDKLAVDPTREKEFLALQAENVNLRTDLAFWKAVGRGEKQAPAWDEDRPRGDAASTPCRACQGTAYHKWKCPGEQLVGKGGTATATAPGPIPTPTAKA